MNLVSVTALTALLAVSNASGQMPRAAESLRLTVEQAVQRALETSHRIAEAIARGDAAEAVVGGRRASTLPQVAVQAGYTRTNHVEPFGILVPSNQFKPIYPDVPSNYRTRMDL